MNVAFPTTQYQNKNLSGNYEALALIPMNVLQCQPVWSQKTMSHEQKA